MPLGILTLTCFTPERPGATPIERTSAIRPQSESGDRGSLRRESRFEGETSAGYIRGPQDSNNDRCRCVDRC
jgi:hypothetical protein